MKTAILIHGFNNRDCGKTNIDRLRPYLESEGYLVKDLDYGWFGLLMAKFGNKRIAKQLIKLIHQTLPGFEVHIFGHSNGCAIMHQAAKFLNRSGVHYHYINPALVATHILPPGVRSAQVWYSPSDDAVKWAPVARMLRLGPKNWGKMGRVGYLGPKDPRIVNHNIEQEYLKLTGGGYRKFGHSSIFQHLKVMAPALLGAR
jgi:pimeloyl-ACP methyl ester carboxylesterase